MLLNFEDLSPTDGYYCKSLDNGSLNLEVIVGLQLSKPPVGWGHQDDTVSRSVWSQENPRPEDYGVMSRVSQVVQSLCRYFNAGGSWSEIWPVLNRLEWQITDNLAFVNHAFYGAYTSNELTWVYLWRQQDQLAFARWEEGVCVEPGISEEEVLAGLDGEEEMLDDGWTIANAVEQQDRHGECEAGTAPTLPAERGSEA